ncbi:MULTISPECIES: hypothetical protein [unclassified Candidatus Accumulibacter]|uniref:hypothetical protein n=1 Tax=unclassified Candidatus Accumulibacter TaxID=2619054 RepID=UPI002D1FAD27|nr:hypothetical protein [Accumulibacter sp.]
MGGVVSAVDVRHADGQLGRHFDAVRQVAMADCLLLAECDLATSDEIARVARRLPCVNPGATQIELRLGRVDAVPRPESTSRQRPKAPQLLISLTLPKSPDFSNPGSNCSVLDDVLQGDSIAKSPAFPLAHGLFIFQEAAGKDNACPAGSCPAANKRSRLGHRRFVQGKAEAGRCSGGSGPLRCPLRHAGADRRKSAAGSQRVRVQRDCCRVSGRSGT